MKQLDQTFTDPAENLACDDALLEWCETRGAGEVLRFWESTTPFVVVGYSNTIAREVNRPHCAEDGVPILRRCTGGGTVVQGPGCFNYALVLRIERDPELETVTGANRFIMRRHQETLSRLLGAPVRFDGHTDLAVGDRKFSGNAQRRKKQCLLFHGTFLLGLDLDRVERWLKFPSKQPDYRRDRSHLAFIGNLGIPATTIKRALIQAWDADEVLNDFPVERVTELAATRYRTAEWNERL